MGLKRDRSPPVLRWFIKAHISTLSLSLLTHGEFILLLIHHSGPVSEHTRYNVLEFVPKDFFLRSTIFKSHEIKKKRANNSSVYEVLKGKTIRSNIIERGGGGGRSLLLVRKIIPDFSVRPAAV